MWRRLALSCSICLSMSERVVRRRPFLSTRVLRLAVVGLALSGALPWSSTLALMVGRHFPARDAGLPQPGPSRAAIAAASRLRAAAVDTAVPVIRGPWRCRFFFERCGMAGAGCRVGRPAACVRSDEQKEAVRYLTGDERIRAVVG